MCESSGASDASVGGIAVRVLDRWVSGPRHPSPRWMLSPAFRAATLAAFCTRSTESAELESASLER